MDNSKFSSELDAAIAAAKAAEKVILEYFSGDFDTRVKADNSPVTEADVNAEKTIRSMLSEAFPDYGFYGEETGQQNLDAEFLWLVDPIDGTKSFVRRSPFFSTQIALMHRGKIVVAVSNAPALQEMAVATVGCGAQIKAREVRGSGLEALEQAFLSTGNIKTLAGNNRRWKQLGEIMQCVARVRGYGDFCHYHQLACGQADLVIESDVNILDIAALSLIVTESGGVFTTLEGDPISLETTSVLAAASTVLHGEAMERLR